MQLARKYLIGSLIFHLVIIIIATIIGYHAKTLKKTFVVFGAHSRKHSFVSYKSSKIVPFVQSHGGRHGGHHKGNGGKHGGNSKGRNGKKFAQNKNKKQSAKASAPKTKTRVKALKKSATKSTKKTKKAQAHAHKKAKQKPVPKQGAIIEDQDNNLKTKATKHKKPKKTKKPKPKEPEEEVVEEKAEEKPIEKPEEKPEEPPQVTQATIPPSQDEKTPDDSDQEDEADASDDEGDDDSSIIDFNLIGDADDQQRKVYQKHVQREVDRLWRPPVGVPKGTICTILFSINAEGDVEEVRYLKRSSVLIYDLSIMRIAQQFKFAPCLWNKQFKIDFKQ